MSGDFFLDCSGFHRLLLAKAYQPKWKSYSDYIRVDAAIPAFMAYAPGQEVPNYTMATALTNGWIWQVPTQERLGRGYVFSTRYTSVEDAAKEMRAIGVDPGENPRVLKFDPGRFEKMWMGNVCAIGLSGGFVEPLEATTIHGMAVQIRLLTDLFLPFCTRESMPTMAEHYNRLAVMGFDDFIDFVGMHYQSGRMDSEFWRDYQKPTAITPANQFRMEKWRHAFPMREDFTGIVSQRAPLNIGMVVWAGALCGRNLLRREHAQRVVQLSEQPQRMRENYERYFQVRNRIVSTALTHAEALAYARQLP